MRALPRGGISQRVDKQLVTALYQVYGLRPDAQEWVKAAQSLKARLELMSWVDTAPAPLFGARRLLMEPCSWLAITPGRELVLLVGDTEAARQAIGRAPFGTTASHNLPSHRPSQPHQNP